MPEGIHTFEYKLGKQFFVNMESTDIHDADLTVKLTVEVKNDLYHLDFTVEGTVTLLCDRCLDSLIWPIDATYSINVRYGDAYDDESDDLLVIPQSSNHLNVSYMIYDTVALAIPIKHVHPLGKCNRQMSALLKKHKARPSDGDEGEDLSLEESLIDEIDQIDSAPESESTDPRWDALKGLKTDE